MQTAAQTSQHDSMTLQPSIPPPVPGLVHWPSSAAQFGLLSLRYLQRTCRKYAAATRNYTQCYAHNHNLCQLSAWQYCYNQRRSQLSCVQLSTKIFTKINFCMVKVIYIQGHQEILDAQAVKLNFKWGLLSCILFFDTAYCQKGLFLINFPFFRNIS